MVQWEVVKARTKRLYWLTLTGSEFNKCKPASHAYFAASAKCATPTEMRKTFQVRRIRHRLRICNASLYIASLYADGDAASSDVHPV